MVDIIAQALFFFLPAYIANMCPVVFAKAGVMQRFKKPVDAGRMYKGQRLFGDHKTYYGFLVGVVGAVVTGLLQALFYDFIPGAHWLFLLPYSFSFGALLGFLLGLGGLTGDLLKSFLKRRLRLKDGAPFFPLDQLDFVFGGLLFGAVLHFPGWYHVAVLLLMTPLLHLLSNLAGYKLGLKKVWW